MRGSFPNNSAKSETKNSRSFIFSLSARTVSHYKRTKSRTKKKSEMFAHLVFPSVRQSFLNKRAKSDEKNMVNVSVFGIPYLREKAISLSRRRKIRACLLSITLINYNRRNLNSTAIVKRRRDCGRQSIAEIVILYSSFQATSVPPRNFHLY